MNINVQHPNITMIRIEINGLTTLESDTAVHGVHDIACHGNNVEIFFEPWGISPIVRFDNHMVHYKAARIHKFDHMIKFTCNDDYLTPYFEQMIEFKMEHLQTVGPTADNIEALIGVNSDCSAIIAEIKQKIKQ